MSGPTLLKNLMIEPRLDEALVQKGSVSERYVHVPGYIVICAIRQ